MVAAYLAKYATKSTEVTGHVSGRLTTDTIDDFADPDGTHTQRLIDACWRLGRPTGTSLPLLNRPPRPRPATRLGERWTCHDCGTPTRLRVCPQCTDTPSGESDAEPEDDRRDRYARLRRWAHMLGFGGHFLTKSRTYSITFTLLRHQRVVFRRTVTSGPDTDDRTPEQPTTLVVNFLQFVGAGWHTTADAMLANTSAAMAREHHEYAAQLLPAIAA